MTELDRYMASITNFDKLSKEQQLDIIKQINDTKDEKQKEVLINKLVEGTIFMVVDCAKKYKDKCPSDIDVLDLISAGNIGLMNAAKNYDVNNDTNACFSSYAYSAINSHIIRELKKTRVVRIPVNYYTYNNKIKELKQKHGDELTDSMICDKLNITQKTLKVIKDCFNTSFLHLDSLKSSDGTPYDIKLTDEFTDNKFFDTMYEDDVKHRLHKYISMLPEKQQMAINALYFMDGGSSLDNASKKFGTSRQNLSSLKIRGIENLRRMILKEQKEEEFKK